MKKKKLFLLLGMGLFMLGIGLNIQYALDEYGLVKNSLHTEVLAQTNSSGGDGSGSGSGSGGSGDTGGSGGGSGQCTERGGTEYPNKILVLEDCTKKISIGGGWDGVRYEYVTGYRCRCDYADFGYCGVRGCNATWETACK